MSTPDDLERFGYQLVLAIYVGLLLGFIAVAISFIF